MSKGNEALLEVLADAQHEIWAHWMNYLFSVSQCNKDGTYTIPADKVARWSRQLNTPYAELTKSEKESDLNQASKILATLKSQGVL